MPQLMPQPWKHPKLGAYYFRKVVPVHLREALGKMHGRPSQTEIRLPLVPPGTTHATKDARVAKLLYPEAAARADAMLARAAGGPVSLSHQQVVALAGEWFRRELASREANPGRADDHELAFDHLETAAVAGRRRQAVANDLSALLAAEGLSVDQDTAGRLADQLFDFKMRLALTLRERAEGDYSKDPILATMPEWTPPTPVNGKGDRQSNGKGAEGASLASLVEGWAKETKPAQRTRYEWDRVVKRLGEHVGHTDPARITAEDIVGWKDALLASGKSAKTVRNHLFAASALFNWAVKDKKLSKNPAAGITVAAKAKARDRRLSYSDDDAKLLLSAARSEKGARRWVPWLLAFTGARLEEVCQSYVSDVRREGEVWFLDINEDHEGKSLKNVGSARKVPLHPGIIAEGFLDYVRKLPKAGPLFPDLTPDRFGRRGGNGTKLIGRWVRARGISDPRKAPNHSWRHRFKDQCRAAGIAKDVHDALTGHSSGDVGDGYGSEGYPLKVLAEAIGKLPLIL